MTDKYDEAVGLIVNNWIGAAVLLVLACLVALPQVRDGGLLLWTWIKKLLEKKRRLTVTAGDDKATLTELLYATQHDVIKVDADLHTLGVVAEYQWIRKQYAGSKVICQALTTLDLMQGRRYGVGQIHFDVITIELEGGRKKDLYFDISSFYSGGASNPLDPHAALARKIARLYGAGEQAQAGDVRNARA